MQLQLLAAATAINLKRVLSHSDAVSNGQTGDPAAHHARGHRQAADLANRDEAIRVLTRNLISLLTEIGRLTTADPSTGS